MKTWKKIVWIVLVIVVAGTLAFLFYLDTYRYDNSYQKQVEDKYDWKMHDSLVATGKHGYYIRWFIVGRIKTGRITGHVPFEISVSKLNPALEGRKISFNMKDSLSFKIRYTLNDMHPELSAKFGEEKCDSAICFTATKTNTVKPEHWKQLKEINYLFEAWRY